MFFYVLEGETYDEYEKTIFMSEEKYSEKEFKDIIKKAYKHCCEVIIKNNDYNEKCEYFLKHQSVLWNKKFNDYIESISNLKAIYGDEIIHVGLGITPNENTKELNDCLKSLDLINCKEKCSKKSIDKKYNCVYEEF